MSIAAPVERAPRVPMRAEALIRRAGDPDWRRATTINISRTGVLLETDGLRFDPQTPVELVVRLPVLGDLTASRILGSGRIARALDSPEPAASSPVMAAHLAAYRLLHDEADAPDVRDEAVPPDDEDHTTVPLDGH